MYSRIHPAFMWLHAILAFELLLLMQLELHQLYTDWIKVSIFLVGAVVNTYGVKKSSGL